MSRTRVHRRTRRPSFTVIALLVAALVGACLAAGAALSSASAATTYTAPTIRQQVSLNTGWKFLRADASGAQSTGFNDSSWTTVNTPHTWNATDGSDGGHNYYRGIGWYRRHYTVPANLAGKALYLQFAGVNQVADVWVNGVYLGQHQGGYSRFRFTATSALKVGADNVIAVKVNNANNADIAPLNADYTFDGGIYRNVSLIATDPLALRMLDYAGPGVYLKQQSVTASSATVQVTSRVFNNYPASRSVAVRTVITDANNNVVVDTTSPAQSVAKAAGNDFVQTVTIANPHRWNGTADPYMYNANVEVRDVASGKVVDDDTEPLGLRSYSVDPNKGFMLNGKYLDLHGVDLHQDRAAVGWAQTDADHTQDLNLIKEIGATAIRMAHYQHDQKDYTLADQLGFVVWAEIPNIDATTASSGYTADVQQQLHELILQNYNHPSIVFWGLGNEQDSNNAVTNDLLSSLQSTAHSLDPNRITTYANCCVGETSTVTKHSDVIAYNKYFGWYSGKTSDLGPWADSLHKAEPTRAIAVSEYGAGANITQHALNPAEPAHGGSYHPEEYQALFHEQSWNQLKTRPYIWGKFVWNMFDFASDGRSEGSQPGINDKGLVTRDRTTRKDAFYWYKANWSASPTLYITSRRWTNRTVAKTDLKVYTNGATVAATLNGTSLGSKASSGHIVTWAGVTLKKGANVVKVTSTINGSAQSDTVTWNLS